MVKKKKKKEKGNPKVIDLVDTKAQNITVVYGKPGTGKTRFTSTFPKPILLIDVNDRGTESAKFPGLKKGDVIVYRVDEFEDIWDALDFAIDDPKGYGFATVIIDHLTGLQKYVHNDIMAKYKKDFMHQQWYGEASAKMTQVITQFNNLVDEDIQPVYIVQQRIDEPEGGELGDMEEELIPEIKPNLTPSVSEFLMTTSRILVQTFIQGQEGKNGDVKMEYRLRTGASPYYNTKITRPNDSTPLPRYIVNPTWDKIEAIIKGEYTEEKSSKTKKKKKRGKK